MTGVQTHIMAYLNISTVIEEAIVNPRAYLPEVP
jgi:hypothetical protein